MSKVRSLPAAEIELLREVAWYSEARSGAGSRFQAAVETAIARMATHPLGGALSYAGTRSALVKGFPFSVVDRLSPEELLIVVIAPLRKRPYYWASRIE